MEKAGQCVICVTRPLSKPLTSEEISELVNDSDSDGLELHDLESDKEQDNLLPEITPMARTQSNGQKRKRQNVMIWQKIRMEIRSKC
ncbi:hypothetical protein L9F63_025074 [Diploptera punctata]|uniref:Uncharacterized protein n=1 Tax=Diploptera punctata TaxID=6984 RepID=A0AAD7ZCK8_DIPPU|nr:hypothetical protein L9F63_025074 [Diploptera punctata]